MEERKLLYYLQCLRGFASFIVCGFHTRSWINLNEDFKTGDFLFSKGFYGVEIFFIISGFIMVYTTKDNYLQSNFKNSISFMIRRIIRIVPLYSLLTIIWYITIIDSYTWSTFIKLIKSLLFIPYNDFPILYLGWSLNYEIFFYLIFAISLLFGKYKYIVLILFFLILISLQPFEFHNSYLNMASNFKLNYFLVGILLALFREKIIIKNSKISLLIAIIAMFMLILFLLDYIKIYNNLYLLFFFIFIIYSIINLDFSEMRLKIKGFYFLGNISFSLYLFHPFIPNLLIKYFNIIPGIFNNMIKDYIFYITMLLSIILFSYLLYIVIEKKLLNKLKTLFLFR